MQVIISNSTVKYLKNFSRIPIISNLLKRTSYINISKRKFNVFYKRRSIYGNKDTNQNQKEENQENQINSNNGAPNVAQNAPMTTEVSNLTLFTTDIKNPSAHNNIVYYYHDDSDVVSTANKNFFQNLPDDKIKFRITGEENQVITVDLHPNEEFIATRSRFFYLTQGVEYERFKSSFSLGNIFKRLMSGTGLFIIRYYYPYDKGFGRICFSETLPSKYIAIRFGDYKGALICSKSSFLLGTTDIAFDVYVTNIKNMFLGGADLFMQKLTGEKNSIAVLKIGGSIIRKNLRPNETLIVRPGQVVMFEETVTFEARISNSVDKFLVAGLSLVNLIGPGEIILQSMDFEELIADLRRSSSGGRSSSRGSKSESSSESKDENADKNQDTETRNEEGEEIENKDPAQKIDEYANVDTEQKEEKEE